MRENLGSTNGQLNRIIINGYFKLFIGSIFFFPTKTQNEARNKIFNNKSLFFLKHAKHSYSAFLNYNLFNMERESFSFPRRMSSEKEIELRRYFPKNAIKFILYPENVPLEVWNLFKISVHRTSSSSLF